LLDNLPRTEQYIEPFGGSGCVLLNRDPSPVETFNDINSEVVNFFDVLRENRDEFIDCVENTPYSREMFRRAITDAPDDDFTRALYFLIRVAQSYNAAEGDTWASSITTSRRDRSQRVSAWEHRLQQIEEVADRFRRVQLECRDAVDVIQRHDHPEALFYCDPPYPKSARTATKKYEHEMSDEQHERLASVLRDAEACVAVSGYQCGLMEREYEGWFRLTEGEKGLAGENTGTREEVLYTNYDPSTV
jgi:DNA adenine methylase